MANCGISQSVYRATEQKEWLLTTPVIQQERDSDPLGAIKALFLCFIVDVVVGLGILVGILVGWKL